MNKIHILKRLGPVVKTSLFLFLFFYVGIGNTSAQTTISTESGTNFTGANGVTGAATITFVVENTTAVAKILTQVDMFCGTTVTTGTVPTLWYSATSLSGAPTITTPTWTSIATGAPITFSSTGYYPALTGLSFIIPALTTYRFAIQSTQGISYSGAAGPPSPNTFSAAGVNLKVYDFQITAANVGYGGSFPSPANNPRAFTGRITFTDATPCTGTPAPGNTISNSNPACQSQNFTLSLQNGTGGTGVTYQWQTSPNGSTWSNAGGASTSSTYSTSQTVATYYRCIVTCGVNAGTSTPLLVNLNPVTACYCNSGATSTADEDIWNVTLGTLNNTSNCTVVAPGPGSALNLYGNYTAGAGAPTAPLLGQGSSNAFSVQVGTCGGNYSNSVAIYIDFNQNGIFDVPAERVYLSTATTVGPHTETGFIAVPATATLGITRMRVISAETAPANIVPCGASSAWGETEDYNVNIVSCIAGAFTSQPSAVTISCGNNASFTVAGNGTGVAYQWQESTNSGGSWNNVNNGGLYSGTNTATLTLANVPASYNGYQYRCVLTGTCTAATNSNAVLLTVTQPPAPTIFPAPPVSACLGTAVPISITTPAGFGAPVTVSFASPNINVPIIDNAVAGANNSIAVSGIPTGAVITKIVVKMNATHTWIGDLVVALKAPNAQILNLDYCINQTNAGNGVLGPAFTNTLISSAGVNALSTGIQPYTATFKADANTAGGYFGAPTGPTGFAATTASWNALYPVANGNWTLAWADVFGGADVGTFINWSIDITYTPIVPYTGIWTPQTGLFTDAAATAQYTGTAVSTVYAKPAASTTYSVTISAGSCTSPATSVPVTVNVPVAITTQPANAAACTDKSTTISVVASGTSPTYQWQVSTDNGTTWANVVNSVNYAGATTSTITISAPPTSWSGYKYRVIVNGAAPCGSVTSNVVSLTVNPLPTVTLTVAPYKRLFPGLRTTITTTSTPAAATYTWFRNGSGITNTAASLLVDVDGLGDYYVKVVDVNGCVNTSNTVSILDSLNSQIFIYPTPNKGQFQVRYYSVPGNVLPRTLSVFDSKGVRVISQTYTLGRPYDKMDVNIGYYGPGVYWVELGDANGKRIVVGRTEVLR